MEHSFNQRQVGLRACPVITEGVWDELSATDRRMEVRGRAGRRPCNLRLRQDPGRQWCRAHRPERRRPGGAGEPTRFRRERWGPGFLRQRFQRLESDIAGGPREASELVAAVWPL